MLFHQCISFIDQSTDRSIWHTRRQIYGIHVYVINIMGNIKRMEAGDN